MFNKSSLGLYNYDTPPPPEFIEYVKCVDQTFLVENKNMKEQIEELKLKLLLSQQECTNKDKQIGHLMLQVNQGKLEKANIEKERNLLVSSFGILFT